MCGLGSRLTGLPPSGRLIGREARLATEEVQSLTVVKHDERDRLYCGSSGFKPSHLPSFEAGCAPLELDHIQFDLVGCLGPNAQKQSICDASPWASTGGI
jgi:hypothetical protein